MSECKAIPQTPPVEDLDFYGEQYSEPVLLHDGESFLPVVARWSFEDSGWVEANFRDGPSPEDYVWINQRAKRWLLLSQAGQPSPCSATDGTRADPRAAVIQGGETAMAAVVKKLRDALAPFANLASTDLSWALVQYAVKNDPERQTFQRPQMQRSFNRAATVYAETAAHALVGSAALQASQEVSHD